MSDMTFAEYHRVLIELGFEFRVAKDGHRLYLHSPSETWVVLPLGEDEEFLPIHHIIGNRRIFDGRGVVSEARFDELLRSRKVQ